MAKSTRELCIAELEKNVGQNKFCILDDAGDVVYIGAYGFALMTFRELTESDRVWTLMSVREALANLKAD